MSFDEAIFLTRAGYSRLQRELDILINEESLEMAERMAQVRESGDNSQEQAYFDVLTDKNMLDERINRLQSILQRATVLEGTFDPESVSPGDRVTVHDLDAKEDFTLDLVSGVEIEAGRRGVSLGSPVGRAILGKKVGDKFEAKAPDGVVRYKVLAIEPIPEHG